MSLSIDDLFTAPTSAQIRASMVIDLVSLGIPADKWRAGGVASTMLTVASMAIALLAVIIVTLLRGFFLPTASGPGLRLLARYMYGVTVPDATFASGSVRLTNAGGGSYTKAVGELTVQNTATKVTYTNDAPFTLGPGPGTFVDVNVIAQVAGSAGNAAPGAIATIVSSMYGVTCSNAASLIGVDAPTDASIQALCLNSLGARSVRGVRTAYAYAVQTATNSVTGAPVNINRWNITGASHTGTVTVIVASPSGVPDANDVAGVATNIEAIARPEAVAVNVTAATTVAYSPSIVLWCSLPSGVTSADAKTAVDARLLTYLAGYPIGGISANDDANPLTPINALFASSVYGECAAAIASLGGTMLSAQGATDLTLTAAQVPTDNITTAVRVLAPTTGTTVL